MKNKSKDWKYLYMNIAETYSQKSSCLKRKVGAVITVNNRIVAAGYNGAPSGIESCKERNFCLRKTSKSGENLENCYATHAEANAICQASKMGIPIEKGTIYVTTKPCSGCAKLIINSGIKKVIYKEDYPDSFTDNLFKEAGIILEQLK